MATRRVSPGVHLPPFQTLIDAHAAELHRFLAASVGARDAEDCLQETFVSALRAYPGLRHADNLRAWLFTIAARKATDHHRRSPGAQPALEADDGRFPSAPGPEPADDGLWAAVRALPERQRTAVVHRFVLDLRYRDIAERMGTSEDAARQNVSAGLRRLRQEIPNDQP